MTNNTTTLRLAAIDLDGTLLGPDHHISPENHAAIDRLARAGLEIVLATGRHHRSTAPYARQLPQVRWIVSSQGAEVATADRTAIVASNFLRPAHLHTLIHAAHQRRETFTPIYYTADEVFTVTPPNDHVYDYALVSGRMPARITPDQLLPMQVQKVIWLGDPAPIASLRTDPTLTTLHQQLQGVQTMDHLYEFMPLETTKAWGLRILTQNLRITPQEVVAFGDAENDIPMFHWAGLSYAMPHGWPNALTSATRTAPAGPPHTAFARAVDQLLS
ncbi:Cof-type HAD-IIB family hydrolase [Luteolibacter soli]|uniref:Cof-type HAD-IIB family hydrolase n=1 Tax=Luteolibacter soli TaxID=3135280 RepID=A0ABU9AVC2_9BACT